MNKYLQGSVVFKNILFLMLGLIISGAACSYYFLGLIKSSNKFNELVVNNQVDYFKITYSDKATKIIKLGNQYIQKSMSASLDNNATVASEILLASTLFLSDITNQDFDTHQDTFLSMMLYYARIYSEVDFQKSLPNVIKYCEKYTHVEDCTKDAMLQMFLDFKSIKYE